MRYTLMGLGLFVFLVATLFVADFQEVPTPMEYALGVLWSGVLALCLERMTRWLDRQQ